MFLAPPPTATPDPNSICTPGDPYLETNGHVAFEAEHFTGRLSGTHSLVGWWWQSTKRFAGYSGSAAMEARPNADRRSRLDTSGPALLYTIEFQNPGRYYVFVRGLGPLPVGKNDSIHVGLNGVAVTTVEGWGLSGFSDGGFTWQTLSNNGRASVVTVREPGTHTFYMWMREDGVVVDKILLSQSRNLLAVSDSPTGPRVNGCVSSGPLLTSTPTPTATP